MSQEIAEISVIIGSFDEKAKYLDVCSPETAGKILDTIRDLGLDYHDNGTSVRELYNKLIRNQNLTESQFREILDKLIKDERGYYRSDLENPKTKVLIKKYQAVSLAAMKQIYENLKLERYYYGYSNTNRSFVCSVTECFSDKDFFPAFREDLILSHFKRLDNFQIINASKYGRKFRDLASTCFVECIYKDKPDEQTDLRDKVANHHQNEDRFMELVKKELSRRKTDLKKEKDFIKKYTNEKKSLIETNRSINLYSLKSKLERNQEVVSRLINTKMLSKDQLDQINQEYDKIVKDLEKTIGKIKEVIDLNKSIR